MERLVQCGLSISQSQYQRIKVLAQQQSKPQAYVVRGLIVEVLTELGYRAIEASDGPAGLEILRSPRRIDLLITDVGLPGGLNGRQVADAARIRRPGLKILFITGYAENAVIGNGHLDPGMEVITKPFTMTALGNKVQAMLEAIA